MERFKRLANPAANASPEIATPDEEYTAFASGRLGTKPQLTLEFRRVNGSCQGFAYAHLYTLDFDLAVGITLNFTQHRVTITGRHLEELYRYLCLHRVQIVQEIDALQAERLMPKTPVVTGLEFFTMSELHAAE
jgi:hypothetical protein